MGLFLICRGGGTALAAAGPINQKNKLELIIESRTYLTDLSDEFKTPSFIVTSYCSHARK